MFKNNIQLRYIVRHGVVSQPSVGIGLSKASRRREREERNERTSSQTQREERGKTAAIKCVLRRCRLSCSEQDKHLIPAPCCAIWTGSNTHIANIPPSICLLTRSFGLKRIIFKSCDSVSILLIKQSAAIH